MMFSNGSALRGGRADPTPGKRAQPTSGALPPRRCNLSSVFSMDTFSIRTVLLRVGMLRNLRCPDPSFRSRNIPCLGPSTPLIGAMIRSLHPGNHSAPTRSPSSPLLQPSVITRLLGKNNVFFGLTRSLCSTASLAIPLLRVLPVISTPQVSVFTDARLTSPRVGFRLGSTSKPSVSTIVGVGERSARSCYVDYYNSYRHVCYSPSSFTLRTTGTCRFDSRTYHG